MRVIEILALGAQLRGEAERQSDSINESHFLVHEVLLQAFTDHPGLTSSDALGCELSSRLRLKLTESAIGHRMSL